MEHEFTDRYGGGPYPDPATMCKGQCEGLGCYPQSLDDATITDVERHRWQLAHDKPDAHKDGPCDGYHFIKCPDCEGTGLAKV